MTQTIAAQYQGPQHTLKGLVREHLMPADSPNLCAQPEHLPKFMRAIDLTVQQDHPSRATSEHARRVIEAAKEVCGDCAARLDCLRVNGPDLALGVVGGLTDSERRELFGDPA